MLIKIQNQNIDGNVSIKNETSEEISIYILSVLRIFHYQPRIDPVSFRQVFLFHFNYFIMNWLYLFLYMDRQGLIRGDSDIIHPIFTWLLSHIDVVQKRAYLSRFLVKVYIYVYICIHMYQYLLIFIKLFLNIILL